MVRLRDAIIYCRDCRAENFYDPGTQASARTKPGSCWCCGKPLKPPPRIRVGKDSVVALNLDSQLFPHHVDAARLYDFSRPVAAVAMHPSDPAVWGLKNLSGEPWMCTTADGTERQVAPGRSVTLADGTRIQFGKTNGEIRL